MGYGYEEINCVYRIINTPQFLCIAQSNDGPKKSVTSQIRVIIPPFAVIRLADNTFKAIPLNAVSNYLKQSNVFRAFAIQSNVQEGTVESHQDIITGFESKTEKTSSSLQITTTYTSTQQ